MSNAQNLAGLIAPITAGTGITLGETIWPNLTISSTAGGSYSLTGTTTNTASETEIFVNGTASSRIAVANNKAVSYSADIIGRSSDNTTVAAFHLKGIALINAAGAVSDIGGVYEIIVGKSPTTTLTITAASVVSGIATLTYATQATVPFVTGQTIVVAGVTNTAYNGTFVVTGTPTTTQVRYALSTNTASSGGTVSNATPAVDIRAGVTNTINVYVTGLINKTISWKALVTTVEV